MYRKELWEKLTIESRQFYASRSDMFDVRTVPDFVAENLKAAGFTEIFEKSANLSDARRWFDSQDLRTCMTAHILGQRDDKDIIEAQSSLLRRPAPLDTINIYKKYFCDAEIMTPMDWREWILELNGFQRNEAAVYSLCFSNRVPFVLIKWKVHADLGNVNLDELMEFTAKYSLMKGLELSEDLPDDCYELVQSWMGQFMRAYQLHKSIGKGQTEGSADRVQDALFRLTQVRSKSRHVTEIGEVTKLGPDRGTGTKERLQG